MTDPITDQALLSNDPQLERAGISEVTLFVEPKAANVTSSNPTEKTVLNTTCVMLAAYVRTKLVKITVVVTFLDVLVTISVK